jgi:hypothetical protein
MIANPVPNVAMRHKFGRAKIACLTMAKFEMKIAARLNILRCDFAFLRLPL